MTRHPELGLFGVKLTKNALTVELAFVSLDLGGKK
jgi:hypothetical protein